MKKKMTAIFLTIVMMMTCFIFIPQTAHAAPKKLKIKVTVTGQTYVGNFEIKIQNKSDKNIKVGKKITFENYKIWGGKWNLDRDFFYLKKAQTIKPKKSKWLMFYENPKDPYSGDDRIDGTTPDSYFDLNITYNKKNYIYRYYAQARKGEFIDY